MSATLVLKSLVRSSRNAIAASIERASRLLGLTVSAFCNDSFASSRLPSSSATCAMSTCAGT
jgi:hypothetical protein